MRRRPKRPKRPKMRGMPIIIGKGGTRIQARPPRPMREMSEKELQSRIYELEYRRIELQKRKIASIRKILMEERMTLEINTLRKNLEEKRKGKKNGKKA